MPEEIQPHPNESGTVSGSQEQLVEDTRPVAHAYIDGFNLYYGLKETGHKWLNIEKLCKMQAPQYRVEKVYYFTALVTHLKDAGPRTRQSFYLRALGTLKSVVITLGKFRTQERSRRRAEPPPGKVLVLEDKEKQSDVNLATQMLSDAFRGLIGAAIVVSNDSDLIAPVKVLNDELKIPVLILDPHGDTNSSELRRSGSASRILEIQDYKQAQFPEALRDEKGAFHRPSHWNA